MARVTAVSWLAQSSVVSRPRRHAANPRPPTRTRAARPPNTGQFAPVEPSPAFLASKGPEALGVGAGIVTVVSGLAAAAGTGLTFSPQPVAGQPSMPHVSPLLRRSVVPAATRTSAPVAFSGTATGADVLVAAGTTLRLSKGLTCGIDGWPATGCGEKVNPVPAAAASPDTTVTIPAPTPSASGPLLAKKAGDGSTGANWPVFGGLAALVLVGGLGFAAWRRGRDTTED